MNETIDEIVRGSSLPISIIIVGIGNDDFNGMEILNANEKPLYSTKFRKFMERDIVQFVPFNKFKDNIASLASETLNEVPRQLTSYMQSKGRRPTDKVATRVGMKPFFELQKDQFEGQLKANGFTDQEAAEIMAKELPELNTDLYLSEVIRSPFTNWLSEYVPIAKK